MSFTVGWLTSELAAQLVVALSALVVVAVALGDPSTPLGWIGLAATLVAAMGLAVHVVAGRRAWSVVASSLASSRGGAIPMVDGRGSIGRWWRSAVAFPLPRRGVEVLRDLDYVGDGAKRHRLDLYRPTGPAGSRRPVIVYVHGGAWVIGDKRQQALPMLTELASRGWVCVAINYRLSPEATWPDHVVDCKAAISWVKEEIGAFGGDPSFMAIAGGSAGGHLATLCALTANDPAFQPGFEEADTTLHACVDLYGVLEMTGDPSSSGRHGTLLVDLLESKVMKRTVARDRALFEAASPLHRLHAGAPPCMVIHGRNDTLVPVEVARQFVERFDAVAPVRRTYVELPLAQHAFDLLASPRSTATTAGIVAFLEQVRAER